MTRRFEVRHHDGSLRFATGDEFTAHQVYTKLAANQAVALYCIERRRESRAYRVLRESSAEQTRAPHG